MKNSKTDIDFQGLFASIFNFTEDAVLSKTLEGIITSWNPAAEKIFGYSSEEAIGKHVSILIPPPLQNEEKEIVKKISAGKLVEHYETKRIRKDGAIVHVSLTISPIKDSSGNIVGASKILRDITGRKEAENKLQKNEKLFRAMIEKSQDMITLALPDGKMLYVSPSLTNVLGFTEEDYMSRPGFEFIHPDDLPGLTEQMTGIMNSPGKSFYREQRLLHKNGTYLWCEGTITNMLHDEDVGALVSNFRDISARKKAEFELKEKGLYIEKRANELSEILLKYTLMDFSQQLTVSEKGDEWDAIAVGLNTLSEELQSYIQQLKESEERIQASQKIFSTVFYKSPVMNSITEAETGNFIEVNENFAKFCGMKKEEIIGKSSLDMDLITFPKHREEIIKGIKDKGYSRDVLMQMSTKSGETKWVSTSAEIVKINGKNCFLTAMIDVTERKKAEEQLLSVNKELEAFSYSVSHDLRAPLRAVNGYAQMLFEDYGSQLDSEGKRIIDTIRYNATKMGMLIDNLLAFSRLGRKEVQKSMVDMNELTEGVLIDMNKSGSHNAKIKIGKLHFIEADYGLIHQVMFNLISNAVKYSSKKENPVVEISSEEKNGEIIFSVKDNGAGFNMKYYDKLFGVFQRLHAQDEFEGTGVGLAIIQRIISKHGGKIWAEGKVNEGAVFHFTVPEN